MRFKWLNGDKREARLAKERAQKSLETTREIEKELTPLMKELKKQRETNNFALRIHQIWLDGGTSV